MSAAGVVSTFETGGEAGTMTVGAEVPTEVVDIVEVVDAAVVGVLGWPRLSTFAANAESPCGVSPTAGVGAA